jgi:predicted nuclease of predicted toxin-antitoxin system
MWRILIDNDFRHPIMRGLKLRVFNLDIVTAPEAGLTGIADPEVLEWAFQEGRIIFSHDTSTMPEHVRDCLLAGKQTTGVVIVQQNLPIGEAIEALVEFVLCSEQSEWENQIVHLPFPSVLKK